MYKSYFLVAWRNLIKDRGYAAINLGGLALGVTVATLIGFWVVDETSYDKDNEHYDQFAVVLQNNLVGGTIETYDTQSYQLGEELRTNYGNNFERVVMIYLASSILSDGEKAFSIHGVFAEPDAPELLSLKMKYGTRALLKDPSSVLISASTAKMYFDDTNPVGKILRLDNSHDLKVIGVYADMPSNSSFHGEMDFIAPLEIEVKRGNRFLGWGNSWLFAYVQLADNVSMEQASLAIKDAKLKNVVEGDRRFETALFLHPMSRWHLYSDFKNGVNTGGRIEFVWMFGVIGAFTLLLACINFMNLSTARSQKRSKEVGVRKVVGSRRGQLVRQFFIESFLLVTLAFILSLVLTQISLPLFNSIAQKNIVIDWLNPMLWLVFFCFVVLTSIIAGSYPALYLSAFSPIKVLKGNGGQTSFTSLPRRILVVTQFTVSITLIIATIVVLQQINHARNRPIGYDMNGLMSIPIKTKEVKANYTAFRNELIANGVASEVSMSETTVANLWWSDWGYQWKGKDPDFQDMIYRGAVDYDFGKTVGWKIKEGRDFSREFGSDSSAMILNETAVAYMGLKDPIGETIRAYGKDFTVIGVVEDMISQSLYRPVKQTVFLIDPFDQAHYINVKINPEWGTSEALSHIDNLFSKHHPNTPFEYEFTDQEFASKFSFEQRVGTLVGIFAALAIFISCLGLAGLAAFVAEQRVKEIGIRKVMGASVPGLWRLISKDFVVLVMIACLIAMPIGYALMSDWLSQYNYRTDISWWIFAVTGGGALVITLLTISIQALKAASMNPVKSLRAE
jgi:predicted permease